MNKPAFAALIESVTNKTLWPDAIPEGEAIPALVYNHVAGDGTRLLSGKKVGRWDTWRVRVVGSNRDECDDMAEKLQLLDNTGNDNFKRVFVGSTQAVPSMPDDVYTSMLVDFKTFDQ